MSLKITRLRGGLRVATDRMDTVETVSVGVYVGVGTRHEPAEANGVAHLLEHMAFKGTTTRSARRIAEEIEAVGGQMNAHTSREQTAYYVKVLKEDLVLGVDILADILQNSTFDPLELDRERTVVLQELGQAADTPDDVIFDHFQETAFPGQAIGRPVLGRAKIIETLPRPSLVDYRDRYYGASNMVVAAAGRVDHAELVELISRKFGAIPPDAANGTEAAHYIGGDFRDDHDLEQLHLVIGFPGVAHEDPDYYAAAVLSTLLGGGMSSRLFQEIRENRGLCYAISAFSGSYVDGGIFGIYTGTGEKESTELMPVLADQLAAVMHPAPDEEVARSRAQMKAGLLMSLESTSSRMDALGSQMLVFDRPIPTEEVAAKIDAVSADDVARVARRVFGGRPTLAALGPLGGLESPARLLERFAAAPVA